MTVGGDCISLDICLGRLFGLRLLFLSICMFEVFEIDVEEFGDCRLLEFFFVNMVMFLTDDSSVLVIPLQKR